MYFMLLFVLCPDQQLSRYCNSDFILLACLVGITLLRIIITYDIICQWSKHFRECMAEFPKAMQIPDLTQINVAILGWHINAHSC